MASFAGFLVGLLFIVFAIMGIADLVKKHGCLGWLMVPLFLVILALLFGWLF